MRLSLAELFHNLVPAAMAADERPFITRARLRALATRVPLLFVMLCPNVAALVVTHAGKSPALLTYGIPIVAVPVFVSRILFWRRLDVDSLTDDQVKQRLLVSMIFSLAIGLTLAIWAVALFPYGGVYARAHIAFFMAVTCIGCMLCLVHMRLVAVALAIVLTVPVVLMFTFSGNKTFIVIGLNYLVVTIVMCMISLSHYDDFRRFIETTRDLGLLNEANRRLAEIDSLTGLANRRSFRGEIEQAIARVQGANGTFAVGLVDLDGFKPINDIYGHQVGDRVLAEVGRRLRERFGTTCVIARLGGDEFAFLARTTARPEVEAIGRAMCEMLAEPFDVAPGRLRIGASIGIACFPDMAQTLDQLLERADFALYHAKEGTRSTAVMFSTEHEQSIRERGKLEHELRRADLDEELSLVFQPVVDTRIARVIQFEALARWENQRLGAVSPAAFIPAAERIGLITEITEILFRKACAAATLWPDNVRLAFNLSTGDLAGPDAKARLCRLVRESGLNPARITFEITETSVMRDFAHSVTVLAALREMGCRIALDDFGTGFSSLRYVHRLPLDKLKIDKSFVQSLATDGVSFAIVRTIVDLCANLEIACVVEGVETQAQADLLFSVGCTVMQGYLFGKPISAAVLNGGGETPWSREWHRARAIRTTRQAVM